MEEEVPNAQGLCSLGDVLPVPSSKIATNGNLFLLLFL